MVTCSGWRAVLVFRCVSFLVSRESWIEIFCLGVVKPRDGSSLVTCSGWQAAVASLVSRESWIEIFWFGVVRSRVCAYQINHSQFLGRQAAVSLIGRFEEFLETKSTHCHLVPWHFQKKKLFSYFCIFWLFMIFYFLFFILNRRNCKLCFCSSILFGQSAPN